MISIEKLSDLRADKGIFFIFLFFIGTTHYSFSQTKQTYPVSKHIVVDQFGYLPSSRKVAVIRKPQEGYDRKESFVPGKEYALVNKESGEVYKKNIVEWLQGYVDDSSGDKAWWFDFSSYTEEGVYYILDLTNHVRSHEFVISPDVYKEVLKQAVRSFYYQRSGFEKEEKYAGKGWADKASHVGPLQDKQCRLYKDPSNASTERDVSGGWYDAGDYNKYTNWTANYIVEMMKAYLEYPEVWTDDYNIPESGNGFPDLMDEVQWGVDHLLRLQNEDGSMISIVGASHASPPSNASGQSLYGSPNTSSALNSAGAFAIASKVYGILGKKEYSEQLKKAAEKAWNWAEKNPRVLFYNNDAASGTGGLAAGQQEEDDYSRKINKLEASVYLFDATGDVKYREYFDLNFEESHLFTSQDVSPWEGAFQDVYLYYASLSNCKKSVAEAIQQTYQKGMSRNFVSYEDQRDPYMAHLDVYTWGSNSIKSIMANNFLNIIYYGLNPSKDKAALTAAEGYVHYLHGVNPLGIVYLSNMYAYGGDKCVNEFYHSWFCNESPDWDRVGVSTYGPPPGFLTGGPNPSYQADDCCPFNCGNQSAERACTSETLRPPMGQPAQKSYKDFNTAWPINSWSVTENSCGYQVNYIRMLSKFVKAINR